MQKKVRFLMKHSNSAFSTDQMPVHVTPDSTVKVERSVGAPAVPTWVPQAVERYLSHTETGISIRQLARRDGCHASTVLRQIRRVEQQRDDPLIDRALSQLAALFFSASTEVSPKEMHTMDVQKIEAQTAVLADGSAMEATALRVLRRLSETGAVLAVAEGMDTAVVVREASDGSTTRTLSVASDVVQAMALNLWIECSKAGRIARYVITPSGRAKLSDAGRSDSMARQNEDFADQHRAFGDKDIHEDGRRRRIRYNMAESPVTALARRKDKEGVPFLADPLVTAAERLREDFELAQMGPKVAQNWDKFLTGGDRGGFSGASDPTSGPSGARDRVAAALRFLGPGLGDVALRCCCYLEGLETAERRMGWSARSGKIVLRIALQRLQHFYAHEVGDVLIG